MQNIVKDGGKNGVFGLFREKGALKGTCCKLNFFYFDIMEHCGKNNGNWKRLHMVLNTPLVKKMHK